MTKPREIIRARARLHIRREELAMLAGVMQKTMAGIEAGTFQQGKKIAEMVDLALIRLPIPPCYGDADGRCPLGKGSRWVPTPADCYLCERNGRRRKERNR